MLLQCIDIYGLIGSLLAESVVVFQEQTTAMDFVISENVPILVISLWDGIVFYA